MRDGVYILILLFFERLGMVVVALLCLIRQALVLVLVLVLQ